MRRSTAVVLALLIGLSLLGGTLARGHDHAATTCAHHLPSDTLTQEQPCQHGHEHGHGHGHGHGHEHATNDDQHEHDGDEPCALCALAVISHQVATLAATTAAVTELTPQRPLTWRDDQWAVASHNLSQHQARAPPR
ncbi:MAG: hypothetical protein ACYTF0_08730 [Planctomycetota bacterium]